MKRTATAIVVVAISVMTLFCAWYVRGSRKSYSGTPASILFGGLVSDANMTIFAAEDQHFFEANGIKLTFKTYDNGLASTNDLLENKLDIAGAAEFAIVAKALGNANIRIITSIDKSYNIYLVALTSRGIKNVADLKGKRIAVNLPGTIFDFYLDRFLILNGMSIRDVTLVSLPSPGQAVDALAAGTVDAAVIHDPYASRVREQYANGTVSWPVQSGQAVYGVFICRNEWISRHPDLVERFLKSLEQAEEYIAQHPPEAKEILKRRYQHDDAYMSRIWKDHQFSLSLNQALITAMEDEARWMIRNKLTTAMKVPDFSEYIYVDALNAVKPEAVSIIH